MRVFRRIYCRLFLLSSYQMLHYIPKCIRIWEIIYSKFSFGVLYRWIHDPKFCFTVTHWQSHKMYIPTVYTMISSPYENFEYGYTHSNLLFNIHKLNTYTFCTKHQLCQRHKKLLTNHKGWVSDGVTEYTVNNSDVQSGIRLYSQMH